MAAQQGAKSKPPPATLSPRAGATDAAIAALLFALALISRFTGLTYPRAVVFDEYHFGKFVNGYLTGEYTFDIHPPLGKLLLALPAWLGGYDGKAQEWGAIGEPIGTDVNLFALRAGPALQGSLLVPAIYAVGRALGLSAPAALLPAAALLLDACTLVESRYVLTDASLLLGIVLQLAGCFESDHRAPLTRGWVGALAASGAGIALAVSTKWTGAATIGVSGLHALLALYRRWDGGARPAELARDAAVRAALLLGIPALVYIASFAVHFALLPLEGPGGQFMTARFRATLMPRALGAAAAAAARPAARFPMGFWAKVRELNAEMLRANQHMRKGHRWGSRWWEWPLMLRSVLYWVGKSGTPYISSNLTHTRIYCIGTPLVWWVAAAAPVGFVAYAAHRALCPERHAAAAAARAATTTDSARPREKGALGPAGALPNGLLLLAGYLLNWLPFMCGPPPPVPYRPSPPTPRQPHLLSLPHHNPAATHLSTLVHHALVPPRSAPPCHPAPLRSPVSAVERVAFLYHFLPPLLHALLLAGVLLDALVAPRPLSHNRARRGAAAVEASAASAGQQQLLDSPAAWRLTAAATDPDGRRWLVTFCIATLFAACFAHFAPLVYGVPMTKQSLDSRMWIATWR